MSYPLALQFDFSAELGDMEKAVANLGSRGLLRIPSVGSKVSWSEQQNKSS